MEPLTGVIFFGTGGTPVTATLTVQGGILRARTIDGRMVELPCRDLDLDIGGASGRMVYCRARSTNVTVCCDDPRFLSMLRTGAAGDLDTVVNALETRLRRTARRNRLTFGIAAIVLVLLGIAGWWIPTRGISHAVNALPLSVDRKIGDAAMEALGIDGTTVRDPVVMHAIQEMIDRLAAQASVRGFDYRFQVIEHDEVNAFALPGGQIVVFTGLLRRAERPEQVAGVLAHEIAHVTARHGLQGFVRAAGLWVLLRWLAGDTGTSLVTAGAAQAMINGYSRSQERAADAEGARMMAAAGLDPRALRDFFVMLRNEPGAELPGAVAWLSTHPALGERIEALDALIPTLPRGATRPLTADWNAVRAALGPSRSTTNRSGVRHGDSSTR